MVKTNIEHKNMQKKKKTIWCCNNKLKTLSLSSSNKRKKKRKQCVCFGFTSLLVIFLKKILKSII